MTKKAIDKIKAEAERKLVEAERILTEAENLKFDLEFKARSESKKAEAKKAVKTGLKESGRNIRFGKPATSGKDKIRPIDYYPDSYYGDIVFSPKNGNKNIIRFFSRAENKGKFFTAKEVNKAIGQDRDEGAYKYFFNRKTLKAKEDNKGIIYYSGLYSEEL